MTAAGTPTVTAFEASIMLYRGLGLGKVWPDFLADNIREKQSIGGFTLKPCCRKKDSRAMRPRYWVHEIVQFIRDVRPLMPGAIPNEKIIPVVLDVDHGLTHRANLFDQRGIRVCKNRTFAKNRPPQRSHFSGFAGAGTH